MNLAYEEDYNMCCFGCCEICLKGAVKSKCVSLSA